MIHFFTHDRQPATLEQTKRSVFETFGSQKYKIWDNSGKHGERTKSFSDGYIRAILTSMDDYLFMVEDDWEFVRHPGMSLNEICEMMKFEGLVHLRFNKRQNKIKLWDKWLIRKNGYCITPAVSNNPHIIDRKAYLEFIRLKWIRRMPGSKGVEEIITDYMNGAIFGDVGHEQMIRHLG